MNRVRALLVDMDGTLVDTLSANYEAYAAALREAGVSVSREAFDEVAAGRNWRQFLPGLLRVAGSAADPAAVAARKAELYAGKLSSSRLNLALAALLESTRSVWMTGLVTTASRVNVTAVLRYHRIESLFDVIVTGSDVARHKPDPEAYRLAADLLKVSPAECIVVEDSDAGVASAAAFGAPCLRIAL